MGYSLGLQNCAIADSKGNLPNIYIKSFSFVEDLDKMYTGAKVILKDISTALLNSLSIGQEVNFNLKRSGDITYVNPMRILSIVPVTENKKFVNELEITLISKWYFDNIADSAVHTGTFGGIVKKICEKYKSIIGSYDIEETEDPSRIRYQTKERTQDFMKRMIPFGTLQKLPVYLYSDFRGYLNLRGLATFANASPKYAFLPDLVAKREEVSTSAIKEKGMIPLRLNDYHTLISLQDSNSKGNVSFSTSNFFSTSKITSSAILSNAENSNAKVLTKTPYSYICKNWSYLPQDALTQSIYEYFQKNLYSFSVTGTLMGMNLDTIQLGDKVRVLLPSDTTSITDLLTSSTSPNYIITHIERKFSQKEEWCNFMGVLVNYG